MGSDEAPLPAQVDSIKKYPVPRVSCIDLAGILIICSGWLGLSEGGWAAHREKDSFKIYNSLSRGAITTKQLFFYIVGLWKSFCLERGSFLTARSDSLVLGQCSSVTWFHCVCCLWSAREWFQGFQGLTQSVRWICCKDGGEQILQPDWVKLLGDSEGDGGGGACTAENYVLQPRIRLTDYLYKQKQIFGILNDAALEKKTPEG